MNRFGSIYKITNKINGKIYIGQTTKTIKQRWYEHLYTNPTRKYILHKSMDKHGRDNFEIEELAVAFNAEELDRLEVQFINELNTLDPNGYNLELGGNKYKKLSQSIKDKIKDSNSGFKCKQPNQRHVTSLDLKTGIEQSYLNLGFAEKDGFCRQAIVQACRGKVFSHKGKRWKYSENEKYFEYKFKGGKSSRYLRPDKKETKKENRLKFGQKRIYKSIDCLTSDIIYFNGTSELETAGFCPSSITRCIKEGYRLYRNKIWSTEGAIDNGEKRCF
jgi:group I intron endonuclease